MAEIKSTGGLVALATPYGQDDTELADFRAGLAAREPLRSHLDGNRYRWLSFRRDDERGVARRGEATGPTRYTATLYDYSNLRTIDVAGALDDARAASVSVSARQPNPTHEEYEEAITWLEKDRDLGRALSSGRLRVYRAMPPLAPVSLPDGRTRRVVVLGLYAGSDGDPALLDGVLHRLVGVDLSTGEVLAQQEMPLVEPQAEATSDCGAPSGNDACPATGMTGQVQLVVKTSGRAAEELWRLVVVRPAESSGTNGSGVELRNVTYRGRSVLERAHVPILNVQYVGATPACGPTFRDWLDQEACFEVVTGSDLIPGFRLAKRPPQTLIESGEDGGNFRGVAVYFDGEDLLLTSEMQAGWYRYITSWRLSPDGTINPRMGIAATKNFCTCQLHIHHAYFRLDFDVEGGGRDRIQEFNLGGALGLGLGGEDWTTLVVEANRPRDPSVNRHWRVMNANTGAFCTITPGQGDGTADSYGAGDTWHLLFKENEIDDGQGFTTNPGASRAGLDRFATPPELIDGQDVVFWYAAHFEHDAKAHPEVGVYLGPTLSCSWAEPTGRKLRLG